MRILVTGGSGMVGKALRQILVNSSYTVSYMNGHKDYDLSDRQQVEYMFDTYHPDVVIHLAARVGGIIDNVKYQGDYILQNTIMNMNILDACITHSVPRMIAMLSTCIYPDTVEKYPLTERDIHLGPPTKTNFSYAYAKRHMAVAIDACNEQFCTKYCYLVPSNLYGPHDKFDERAHFVGALIRKIWMAKQAKQDHISLFGTGKPLRQFMYVDDVAEVIKHCVENDLYVNMNLAPDEEYTIDEIARTALRACDFDSVAIRYNPAMPDGQYRKTASNARLKQLVPGISFTPLSEGLKKTWDWYSGTLQEFITLGE